MPISTIETEQNKRKYEKIQCLKAECLEIETEYKKLNILCDLQTEKEKLQEQLKTEIREAKQAVVEYETEKDHSRRDSVNGRKRQDEI